MQSPEPTISRAEPDGTLVELLYRRADQTTAFAVRRPDGEISIVNEIDLAGVRLAPYSAKNNLLTTGCVKLPSDIGDFRDKGELVRDIRAFIHRYADLSPLFEEIVPYYVLLTWLPDAFNEMPYLRFRGDYGTGKTRTLLTIGSLCHKAFMASGASSVSPIFRILDAFQGTLVLDEADFRFSDATCELTKVLNNGNVRGMPVLRTTSNRNRELNPEAFRVFGPKLIAMRESFADKALESRFITEETGGRKLRSDIPIHLPNSLELEAQDLRNRLLAWRFHAWGTLQPDAGRLIANVEPRLNQTAFALLALIDEEDIRRRVTAEIVGIDSQLKQDRSETDEAALVRVLRKAFAETDQPHVSVAEITRRFNAEILSEIQVSLTNKKVGWMLRSRLHLSTSKSNGVFVIPQHERGKIEVLADRMGLDAIQTLSTQTAPH